MEVLNVHSHQFHCAHQLLIFLKFCTNNVSKPWKFFQHDVFASSSSSSSLISSSSSMSPTSFSSGSTLQDNTSPPRQLSHEQVPLLFDRTIRMVNNDSVFSRASYRLWLYQDLFNVNQAIKLT